MIAYLDLPSGLSGDMFLGCLVHAGWGVDALRGTIARLALDPGDWSVEARRVMRGPLSATLVDVHASDTRQHRHLPEIRGMIERADLPATVREQSVAVFERLAGAEARVHGTTADRVHFHEVGAIDAIIDIVGATAGLHDLGIETLHASAVPLGEGWNRLGARSPAPARARHARTAGRRRRPTRPAPAPGEWVTPTGAALLATLATFGQP